MHKHNAFRSYCNTNIINKPDVKSITEKLKKFLKEEQYLIKVEVEGCPFCGNDSLVEPEVFTKKVTLEELPQYFKYLSEPFWQHQDVNWRTYTDEEFCDNIPYEEKKWGIYKSVQIIERIE